LILVLLAFVGGLSAGCAPQEDAGHALHLANVSQLPADIQAAPVVVQQAYQFAVAYPEILQRIPCYCGCGAIGHESNYACYVAGTDSDGKPIFDSHALGCSICVDITQDTMRLLRQGKDVPAILVYLEQTYSRYGPSNLPG
jgi:hypothetical protein